MTDIRADVDALRAQSERLFDVADEISAHVTAARSSVTDLVGAGWSGGAATAFSLDPPSELGVRGVREREMSF